MDFTNFLFFKDLFYSYLLYMYLCLCGYVSEYPRKPIERYLIAGSWSYGQLEN